MVHIKLDWVCKNIHHNLTCFPQIFHEIYVKNISNDGWTEGWINVLFSPATSTPVQEGVHFADVVQYTCTWMCAGKRLGR